MRPPPVVWLVVCFGAGLATGLARFGAGPAWIGCLVLAIWWRRSDRVLLPAAALLGLVHAVAAHQLATERCAARLRSGPQTLNLVLHDAGRVGIVTASPAGVTCRGTLQVRWPARPAVAAGKTVTVQGRWVPQPRWGQRPDGVFVVRRVGDIRGRPPWAARLRGWVTETAERRFGGRAGLVDALVLGRRGAMDPRLKDAFAQSGLVHLLSISGFHVGLITAWLVLLLRALRVPRVRAVALGATASAAYVGFLGWPAPATRAAALGLVLALAFARQRRIQPTPLLLLTCLAVLLIDPWAIGDLGAWLSAAALWGATTFTRWSDRALGAGGWVRTLSASVGATLAAAPITAWALGTVAIAGILLNFAGIPLAALAVPGVLLSLLLSPLAAPAADAMAAGTGLVLAGLERVALLGAAIPGGAITMERSLWGLGFWLLVVAACCGAMHAGRRLGAVARRGALVLAGATWLWVALFQVRVRLDGRGELTLFFLRVGQGDAAVLRTPHGRWLVVDAGPAGDGRDAGRDVVVPFLRQHGARHLAGVFVSHAHADHLGGAGSVLQLLPAAAVVEPAAPVRDSLYLAFLDQVAAGSVPWRPGRRGDAWTVDGVRLRVLHPDTTWHGWGEDLNEDSLVLLVEFGGFRALFTGDAGFPVETLLRGGLGRVHLLKVGHHGSRTATGDAWLAELRPEAAVVSVGINNYGHPAPETLRRIAAARAGLWRTDRDGVVEVRTDGRRAVVRGRGRRAELELRAPGGG